MIGRVALGAVLLASCAVAAADAAGPANGPIFFVGSRADNFYAEIYSIAADGSARANLTSDPASDYTPAVSPDGRQIAFVSERDGFDAIYVMDADGGRQQRVSGRLWPYAYFITSETTWSPSGRRLAFRTDRPGGRYLFGDAYESFVVDLPSRLVRRIGHTDCVSSVSFSADERFLSYSDGCGPPELKVAPVAGGRERSLDRFEFVGWAPTGNKILFLRRTRDPKIRYLGTMDARGRHRWVLGGIPASTPVWSPSGRLIAFVRPTGRRPGLYVVRPGAHRPRRLGRLTNLSAIAWSPNGAWLALSSAAWSRKAGAATYVVRSSGRGLRRVSNALSQPVWSRSGRHFAFVGVDHRVRVVSPPDNSAVAVTRAPLDTYAGGIAWGRQERLLFSSSGPGLTQLLAVEPDGSRIRPVGPEGAPTGPISPDGARVAFVRDGDIWTARLDGSDERQVTDGPAHDGAPAWSPDGVQLAFGRDGDIYVVAAGGGAVRRLTSSGMAGGPSWAPDGIRIAYRGPAGLSVVRSDGSGLHVIAGVGLRAWDVAAWSPDGTKLALGGCMIAVVNADGGGYRELTADGVREGDVAWSPDGTKIVFVRSPREQVCGGTGWGPADSDLWTINADGSGEARLTAGPWPDTSPTWMPTS